VVGDNLVVQPEGIEVPQVSEGVCNVGRVYPPNMHVLHHSLPGEIDFSAVFTGVIGHWS
jgi:hypothetical protein